jgi:hypothetical protein
MGPLEIVEAYIGDVVRLLPSQLRGDVARELSSLFGEELETKARDLGKYPDAAMAMDLVRAHGQPNEVAARYQVPWTIIDPADSTSFLRAAIIGLMILCLMWGIGKRSSIPLEERGFKLEVDALSWIGLLTAYFGLKAWSRKRWPQQGLWVPRDRDRVSWVGVLAAFPLAGACMALYAAPVWFLDTISGNTLPTGWASYTAEFTRWRLPFLIGLQAALLVLLAHAAWVGRWRKFTRRLSILCNLILAILVLVISADGAVFQLGKVDQVARGILGLVGLVYLPSVGMMIHRELGRVEQTIHPKKNGLLGAMVGSPTTQ